MSRLSVVAIVILTTSIGWSAQAADCGPIPVVSSVQAVCLAREVVEGSVEPPWKTNFMAQDAGPFWYVRYEPASSSVRGGAGLARVDKASGKAVVLQAVR